MTEQPRPPKSLSEDGRGLWRDVVSDCAEQDLELTPIERRWLRSACELADQAAAVKAELASAPLVTTGSQGQMVSNPLTAEWRQLQVAVSMTLARIKTDVPESTGSVAVNQPRSAAHTRWRGKGA